MSGAASQKIDANIASITAAKKNVPQRRCVSTASIRSSVSRRAGRDVLEIPSSSLPIAA